MSVRVRFAPSPTGAPHIGNIRTALFNWLFARHHGGKFVLRIEDTDQAREVENGLELIMESLRWLGLDWDEGPDVGGPYGPYRQSERLATYQEYAQQLLANGHAYYCFCSEERLAQMRAEQQARKQPPGYDRRCRSLTTKHIADYRAQGIVPVVRLAVPLEGRTTYYDQIHGEVGFDNAGIDDQVLYKSDGFPTYHMAVVVDDHLMQITHILRGDAWISSVPKHVLLYRAFGWTPPNMAHLPLIHGPDHRPLAKRHGATSALEFRDQGYLVETLVNFLALLGWSYDDKTELFTRDDLVRYFDLDKVNPSPAIFNREKLDWLNGLYIRRLSTHDLAQRILPFVARAGYRADLEDLEPIVPLIQERIKTLREAVDMVDFLFVEKVTPTPAQLVGKGMTAEESLAALRAARQAIETLPAFDEASLETSLRALNERLGLKAAQFFGIIRVAVTGKTISPPLFGSLAILGREKALARMKQAEETLEAISGRSAH